MTKEQLIAFIDDNYENGEHILFQTLSFKDIEPFTTGGKEHWEEFVEFEASYTILAEEYSETAVNSFNDFAKTPKENNQ